MIKLVEDIDILYVEDNESLGELMESYMEEESGWTVDFISDPTEAKDLLEQEQYDVIVSDHNMPEKNGLDLYEDIKEEYEDIPFLLYTGKGSEEIAAEAVSLGVDSYVKKGGSGSLDLLSNEISNKVEKRRTEQELHKSRKKLEQEHQLLENFASIVSHDLRNPLNVLQSYVDILQRDLSEEYIEENPEVQTYLDHMESSTERMEEIIEYALKYEEVGLPVDETETVGLDSLASDCWENVESEDSSLNVIGDISIEADEPRLKSLMENLYSNSIDHGGEDVEVTVGPIQPMHTSTRAPEAGRRGFFVEDDGPGVPEGIEDKIFDFGVSSDQNGTGFGLSIVDQVVKSHGWDIDYKYSDGARWEITVNE